MTPYIVGLAITILIQLIGFVWKFATMSAKITDAKEDLSAMNGRLCKVENGMRNNDTNVVKISALEQSAIEMRKDIKSIDGKLNNIIGKLDMFMAIDKNKGD